MREITIEDDHYEHLEEEARRTDRSIQELVGSALDRAEMWTRNVKHFPMFPDLIAPY